MKWAQDLWSLSGRRLSVQLSIAVTFLVAAGSVVTALFVGTWAMSKVDGQSLDRQVHFARSGLEERFHKIPTEQESSTIWDDAVVQAKARNLGWLEENLGVWMNSYFGHDFAYVLDDRDAPIYAMKDGESVAATAYWHYAAVVTPLVTWLRHEIGKQSASPDAIGKLGALDYAEIDGMPAVVSVKPIVPNTDAVTQVPGSEYLHVSVERVDAGFLATIASQYALDAPRLIPAGGTPPAYSVPIRTKSGTMLGSFAWKPYTPGADIFKGLAPTLGLLSIPAIALLLFLLGTVWRSSRQLEASEGQARFLAFHDTLTGLPNRALFDDSVERALSAQRHDRKPLAVLLIDVDRFKQVNDTQGHPAGDELVRGIGARLASLVRTNDTVARIGGDEFGILVTSFERADDIEDLADRIADAMQEPFVLFRENIVVSVSVGIVVAAGPGMTKAELLRKADIALYDAKSRGGRRHRMFVDDMDEIVLQRRKVELDLRHALDRGNELWVAFQPLFAADATTILGAEALVRWDHPVHGQLSPELFVGIAEERGLIEALAERVLEEACELLAEIDLPWVAVNISAVQFHDSNFAQTVLATLNRHGIAPRRLQLEITESALIDEASFVQQALRRLRDAGVQIVLDDFGTGYSSMNYLRQYPVDKIKIDRSFIQQLGSSREADAMVRAFITLARAMKKRVVAEGIETPEQRDHLAALGCHELQGFGLARPVPKDQLRALVSHNAEGLHRRLAEGA